MKKWYRSDPPQNQNVVLQIFLKMIYQTAAAIALSPLIEPTKPSYLQASQRPSLKAPHLQLHSLLYSWTPSSKHLNSSKQLNSGGKMAQCIGHQSPSVGCGLCQRWTCTSQLVFCKEASQTQSSPPCECWCWFNCHYQELHIVVFFSSCYLYA